MTDEQQFLATLYEQAATHLDEWFDYCQNKLKNGSSEYFELWTAERMNDDVALRALEAVIAMHKKKPARKQEFIKTFEALTQQAQKPAKTPSKRQKKDEAAEPAAPEPITRANTQPLYEDADQVTLIEWRDDLWTTTTCGEEYERKIEQGWVPLVTQGPLDSLENIQSVLSAYTLWKRTGAKMFWLKVGDMSEARAGVEKLVEVQESRKHKRKRADTAAARTRATATASSARDTAALEAANMVLSD